MGEEIGVGVRVTRGVSEKSAQRPGVGLDQSGRRGVKRNTFKIFCEGRTIGLTDELDVGDEGNAEVSGLHSCMKLNIPLSELGRLGEDR